MSPEVKSESCDHNLVASTPLEAQRTNNWKAEVSSDATEKPNQLAEYATKASKNTRSARPHWNEDSVITSEYGMPHPDFKDTLELCSSPDGTKKLKNPNRNSGFFEFHFLESFKKEKFKATIISEDTVAKWTLHGKEVLDMTHDELDRRWRRLDNPSAFVVKFLTDIVTFWDFRRTEKQVLLLKQIELVAASHRKQPEALAVLKWLSFWTRNSINPEFRNQRAVCERPCLAKPKQKPKNVSPMKEP